MEKLNKLFTTGVKIAISVILLLTLVGGVIWWNVSPYSCGMFILRTSIGVILTKLLLILLLTVPPNLLLSKLCKRSLPLPVFILTNIVFILASGAIFSLSSGLADWVIYLVLIPIIVHALILTRAFGDMNRYDKLIISLIYVSVCHFAMNECIIFLNALSVMFVQIQQ